MEDFEIGPVKVRVIRGGAPISRDSSDPRMVCIEGPLATERIVHGGHFFDMRIRRAVRRALRDHTKMARLLYKGFFSNGGTGREWSDHGDHLHIPDSLPGRDHDG